uniref:Family with sequence similarity 219 member A n=1 Tax=Astyanax mexicanus TaxID=7994 RepID=A0A3B1IMJ6_ASTMX
MMEEIDRFQVPTEAEMQALDPASSTASEADSDTRESEPATLNYKPSPLQRKIEKQREMARKGSLKNGTTGSPVNQQPKKNNVMARTRLVVPNKGYSSLDQSPDEKPLVALDTDSDDDFDVSRYSSSGYSSAEVRSLREQVPTKHWLSNQIYVTSKHHQGVLVPHSDFPHHYSITNYVLFILFFLNVPFYPQTDRVSREF